MRIEKGRVAQAMLRLEPGGDPIELAPFDPLDAAGKRHGGKVILQSRHDRCEFSSAWRTNKSE
jgi:hypothetical protein